MNSPIEQREVIARIIDPSRWRVLDTYLAEVKRKPNAGYDPDNFKDRASLAKADAILSAIAKAEIHSLVEEDEGSSNASRAGTRDHSLAPIDAEPSGLTVAEALAFMAGWNARETGSGHRADGRESCLGMFERGFNFGDADTGEDISRGSPLPTHPVEGGCA